MNRDERNRDSGACRVPGLQLLCPLACAVFLSRAFAIRAAFALEARPDPGEAWSEAWMACSDGCHTESEMPGWKWRLASTSSKQFRLMDRLTSRSVLNFLGTSWPAGLQPAPGPTMAPARTAQIREIRQIRMPCDLEAMRLRAPPAETYPGSPGPGGVPRQGTRDRDQLASPWPAPGPAPPARSELEVAALGGDAVPMGPSSDLPAQTLRRSIRPRGHRVGVRHWPALACQGGARGIHIPSLNGPPSEQGGQL